MHAAVLKLALAPWTTLSRGHIRIHKIHSPWTFSCFPFTLSPISALVSFWKTQTRCLSFLLRLLSGRACLSSLSLSSLCVQHLFLQPLSASLPIVLPSWDCLVPEVRCRPCSLHIAYGSLRFRFGNLVGGSLGCCSTLAFGRAMVCAANSVALLPNFVFRVLLC